MQFLKQKAFSHPPERTDFLYKEKIPYMYLKNNQFFYNYQKKKFLQTKNFLYFSEKLISYTCMKKLKLFILDFF